MNTTTTTMSNLETDRRTKMNKIRALGIDPYENSGLTFTNLKFIRLEFNRISAELKNKEDAPIYSVSGRVILRRGMGKLSFLTIQDEGERIQVALDHSRLSEKDRELTKLLDLADIVDVEGILFPTKTNECTIWANKLFISSKNLVPPPDKVHGLEDHELRYRNRHIDLLNPEVRNVLLARSRIIRNIRHWMDEEGYVEVETPVLMTQAGGAAAKPFATHHNALDMDMVLRIAPELYLKRLLVGGINRVYEIGKNFRNEGISPRHNPEFTVLEAYVAHGNYKSMMDEVRHIIQSAAKDFKTKFNLFDKWNTVRLDELVSGSKSIEEKYEIFENELAHTLMEPTFVTHLPKSVVPLAKTSKEFPDCAEVFELYIGGQEIAPGYTEQNDPDAQLEAFKAQSKDGHVLDNDFVEVLKFGMPPAGGFGIGLDRLVMLLCGCENVRDVILFPTLKPHKD